MSIIKTLRKNSSKGFTLVELLVVIAIIGVLATLILLQLGAARQKARDAKRVADINQVRSALELFFDDNGRYSNTTNLNVDLVTTGRYLTLTPVDPLNATACNDMVYDGGGCYGYAWDPSAASTNPIRFHVWAELERRSTANSADIDFNSTGWPATGGTRVDASVLGETCPDSDLTNSNCEYDVGQTQ